MSKIIEWTGQIYILYSRQDRDGQTELNNILINALKKSKNKWWKQLTGTDGGRK